MKESETLKINLDKVLLDRTISIPGFTLERYKKLRRSKLSIISKNCWGGFLYHTFGLPFLSPTINAVIIDELDFLKFLSDLMSYMNKELRFCKMNFNEVTNEYYPSFYLGDVLWTMLHYVDEDSINTARQKWEERRTKINWYNLLVMDYTKELSLLEKFDELPFAKKVCFVPFETDLDSGFYINDSNSLYPNEVFDEQVLDTARSAYCPYDLWDMLLYGKKTPLKVANT